MIIGTIEDLRLQCEECRAVLLVAVFSSESMGKWGSQATNRDGTGKSLNHTCIAAVGVGPRLATYLC